MKTLAALLILVGSMFGQSVTLTWTASTTPNVTYSVYRNNGACADYGLIANSITDLFYVDTTVQQGGTYCYVATAVDLNGAESTYSNTAQVTIPTSIGSPSNLTITQAGIPTTLTWDASSTIGATYKVYKNVNNNGWVAQAGTKNTTYTFSPAKHRTICFEVTAVYKKVPSAPSNTVCEVIP